MNLDNEDVYNITFIVDIEGRVFILHRVVMPFSHNTHILHHQRQIRQLHLNPCSELFQTRQKRNANRLLLREQWRLSHCFHSFVFFCQVLSFELLAVSGSDNNPTQPYTSYTITYTINLSAPHHNSSAV